MRAVHLLRQPHAVYANHRFCRRIHIARLLEINTLQTGNRLNFNPACSVHARLKRFKPPGMFGNKQPVQHTGLTRSDSLRVHRQHLLANAHDGRHVATRAHLQVHMRQLRCVACQHFQRILRIHKLQQALLSHRVEGDDFAASLDRLLQRVQKARAVGAGVLTHVKNGIAVFEVFQQAGAHRGANYFLQPHRRGFMAHVGTVRQVVVAIKPRQQPVQIRGFKRGLA